MKLRLVKPSQGVAWVRQGILVFRQQWLGFVGLVALMVMLASLLTSLPNMIGTLLFAAGMPVVWMGFLLATRRVLTGGRISPAVMFEAFQGPDAPKAAFAKLGLVYVVLMALVELAAGWLGPDPEALQRAARQAQDASEAGGTGADPVLLQGMMWRLGLMAPVSLLFWHTPALLLWARASVAKALFFSAVATWRNLGAFIVYGLTWFGLTLALAMLNSLVMLLVPLPWFGNMVVVTSSMVLAACFHASIYFSVVDCFEPQVPGGPAIDEMKLPE